MQFSKNLRLSEIGRSDRSGRPGLGKGILLNHMPTSTSGTRLNMGEPVAVIQLCCNIRKPEQQACLAKVKHALSISHSRLSSTWAARGKG